MNRNTPFSETAVATSEDNRIPMIVSAPAAAADTGKIRLGGAFRLPTRLG
jgi:hypothetical protein